MGQRFRFRDYTIRTVVDPLALPEYNATCVTGEETDCGATSGVKDTPDALVRWIAEHCRDTGHADYQQSITSVVRAEPGTWH